MKKRKIALVAILALSATAPVSSFARIYKICDFHECCFIDSSGNGHCVPNNTQA